VKITTRELQPDDWPTIEELFGPRGACGGCWCMSWRSEERGQKYREQLGEPNRKAFRKLVKSGVAHGALAFDGDTPVGWCSVGPRADFPKLQRSRVLQTEWGEHTWSITCFYIKSAYRSRGVGTLLAKEALRIAARHGATNVEAYPAVPYDTTKPMPAAFAWTGIPALFERLRFTRLRRTGRPIYRKGL
jgi:ribosomal protein S18 acetylase RimI-like enzyme